MLSVDVIALLWLRRSENLHMLRESRPTRQDRTQLACMLCHKYLRAILPFDCVALEASSRHWWRHWSRSRSSPAGNNGSIGCFV